MIPSSRISGRRDFSFFKVRSVFLWTEGEKDTPGKGDKNDEKRAEDAGKGKAKEIYEK